MLAEEARIDDLVLCKTNTAINARLKVSMTVLAETALKLGRHPETDLHGDLSGQLNVTISQLRIFREDRLCLLEKGLHTALRYAFSFTSIPGKLRHNC